MPTEPDDPQPSDQHPEPREQGSPATNEEIVDGLPIDNRAGPDVRRVSITESFAGPLPPPDVLKGYDDVVPGLGREIVDQWKAETAHRHATIDGLRDTDDRAMTLFYAGEKRGRTLGFPDHRAGARHRRTSRGP